MLSGQTSTSMDAAPCERSRGRISRFDVMIYIEAFKTPLQGYGHAISGAIIECCACGERGCLETESRG